MAAKVQIDIDAKDNASGVLGNIAKGIAQGFGQSLFGAVSKGIGALPDLFKSAITAASDLNETTSKVQVVFGKAAESVLRFGETSANALGMSSNEALAAAGTYGNLFRSMGMGEDASAKMSTNLVQLAADLASFNNIDPSEALEKLRAGLTGESEPLKTLGINLNETTLQEEARRLGLIKGKEPLTAITKAQAAYSMIMKQSSLAQGDFTKTSKGLANQQRILAANMTNLKATIGTALLPVVNALMLSFNKLFNNPALIKGFHDLSDWLAENLPRALDFLTDKWENVLLPAIQAVWNWVNLNVFPIVIRLYDWLKVNIPAAIATLKTWWETNFIAPIQKAWGWVRDNLGPVFDPVLKWFETNIPAAIGTLKTWWETQFSPAVQTAWNWVLDNAGPVFQPVVDWIQARIPEAITIFRAAWDNNIVPAFTAANDYIVNTYVPTMNALQVQLETEFPIAAAKVKDAVDYSIVPGLMEIWNWVTTYVSPVLTELEKFITNIFNISLGTLGVALDSVWGKFKTWYESVNGAGSIDEALRQVNDFITQTFGPNLGSLGNDWIEPLKGALGGLQGALNSVYNWLKTVNDMLANMKMPDWLGGSGNFVKTGTTPTIPDTGGGGGGGGGTPGRNPSKPESFGGAQGIDYDRLTRSVRDALLFAQAGT